MARFFLRWFSPLIVTAGCLLPGAVAQPPPKPNEQTTRPAGSDTKKEETERTPGVQYLFAMVSFLVILFILCKPSRKN